MQYLGFGYYPVQAPPDLYITWNGKLPKSVFIEIKEQYLDPSKLEDLGWRCRYKIREGIRASIPWYTKYNEDPKQFYWAT